MKSLLTGLFSLLVFGIGLYASAGGACKDNFTVCTENGCGNMDLAEDCKLYCFIAGGTLHTVQCKKPGEIDESSVPETGSP